LNMPHESVLVEQAVRLVIEQGVTTKDIGGSSSTVEVGDAVAKELETLFKAQ
jgi:3-isopropylmalate dehydrogenase